VKIVISPSEGKNGNIKKEATSAVRMTPRSGRDKESLSPLLVVRQQTLIILVACLLSGRKHGSLKHRYCCYETISHLLRPAIYKYWSPSFFKCCGQTKLTFEQNAIAATLLTRIANGPHLKPEPGPKSQA